MVDNLTILGESMENSRRPDHILKAYDDSHAYGDMLIHYAMSCILRDGRRTINDIPSSLAEQTWINLGGQLVKESDLNALRHDICNGTLDSWDAIHHRYDELWNRYADDKLHHALHALCTILGTETMTDELWHQALAHEKRIQHYINEQVYLSRKKDHDNPFRSCTSRNAEEELIVYGEVDANHFVRQVRTETSENIHKIEQLEELI